MGFQSVSFLIFLAATAVFCCLAGRKSRTAGTTLLLVSCAVFYLWNISDRTVWGGFLVLLGGTMVTWAAAGDFSAHPERKKGMFFTAVCWHVGMLLWYKYAAHLFGGWVKGVWMPLGLSFFTFQQIWYLKEAYTGAFLKMPSRREYCLYSFFFPTVASGPILRPGSFFPQLQGERFLRPDSRDRAEGMYAVSLGMAKKVLLADQLGIVVNQGWSDPAALSAPAAWLVILSYTLQLYLDFSGYCDIAAGAARLLGMRLPMNFDSPYRSRSVGEFWKRWHITLTTFLRECVYIPLGGSRKGAGRTYFNILLVFVISGLWHGSGWTFLIWGLLHGLAQVAERIWGQGRDRLPGGLRWLLTFLFVNVAWVFFRAPSLSAACRMLSSAVFGGWGQPDKALVTGLLDTEVTLLTGLLPALRGPLPWLGLAALLGLGLWVSLRREHTFRAMDTFRPTLWRALLCAALLVWSILSFSARGTFIYSNF